MRNMRSPEALEEDVASFDFTNEPRVVDLAERTKSGRLKVYARREDLKEDVTFFRQQGRDPDLPREETLTPDEQWARFMEKAQALKKGKKLPGLAYPGRDGQQSERVRFRKHVSQEWTIQEILFMSRRIAGVRTYEGLRGRTEIPGIRFSTASAAWAYEEEMQSLETEAKLLIGAASVLGLFETKSPGGDGAHVGKVLFVTIEELRQKVIEAKGNNDKISAVLRIVKDTHASVKRVESVVDRIDERTAQFLNVWRVYLDCLDCNWENAVEVGNKLFGSNPLSIEDFLKCAKCKNKILEMYEAHIDRTSDGELDREAADWLVDNKGKGKRGVASFFQTHKNKVVITSQGVELKLKRLLPADEGEAVEKIKRIVATARQDRRRKEAREKTQTPHKADN